MISYFFVPMIVFVFCYGRIVVVMRRQIRVMAAHNVEGSAQANASDIQSKRVKWNIVKTMIYFTISLPDYFINLLKKNNQRWTESNYLLIYFGWTVVT